LGLSAIEAALSEKKETINAWFEAPATMPKVSVLRLGKARVQDAG